MSIFGGIVNVREAGNTVYNWTPTLTVGGGGTITPYLIQQGYYIKVGRMVFFQAFVKFTPAGVITSLKMSLPVLPMSISPLSGVLRFKAHCLGTSTNAASLAAPLFADIDQDSSVGTTTQTIFDATGTAWNGASGTLTLSGSYLI